MSLPKLGLVETVNAKLLARYGRISVTYKTMLYGKPIPPYVLALAEHLKRTKLWEETQVPEDKEAIPPCPTLLEVDAAVANLRALCAFAESHGGPAATGALVKFARWTVYLTKNAQTPAVPQAEET